MAAKTLVNKAPITGFRLTNENLLRTGLILLNNNEIKLSSTPRSWAFLVVIEFTKLALQP